VLVEGHIQMRLGAVSPGLEKALALLAGDGAEESALEEAAGDDELMALQMLLRKLETKGWLDRVLESVATLSPVGHDLALVLLRPPEVVLSRFAYVRVVDGELVVETPKASVRVTIHDPAAAQRVLALAEPGSSDDPLVRLLVRAGIAVAPGAEDGFEFAQWSFADLLEHARSRVGRNLGGYGGSYLFEEQVESLPVVKPQFEPSFALPKPDLDAVAEADLSFTRVLEGRRSVREHDDAHPITAAQLGEFLYRAARMRETFSDGKQELSTRPYPSGGAAYELELYPLVQLCEGIEPALYHYDPKGHTLGRVAEPGPRTTLLLEYTRFMAVMETPPQVAILVAARFGRVTWKYESMAYALVLKHVGVLYQTMYLVATAMGLAPCALGGGNSDAFAAATGLDYYEEPAVGEFILGSRPAG
jgi:SagB-type dehydrogenase family enzyme